MLQLIRNRDLYGTGLYLLITILIGYQEMISPAIGIFILIVISEGFIFKSLKFSFGKINFLFVLLFLWYTLGLLWAEHRDIGWKLLEYKMSFFIFPILFLFRKESTSLWLVLQGVLLGSLLLVARILFIHYSNGESVPIELMTNSVLKMHPSYACIYFSFAIFFLIFAKKNNQLNWHVVIVSVLVILFAWMTFKLASFAGVLFLALLFFVLACRFIFIKFRWLGLAIVTIGMPVVFLVVLLKSDRFSNDIDLVKSTLSEFSEGKESYIKNNLGYAEGTRQRVLLWLLSSEIVGENPLGVGTGDIDFHMNEKCDKYELVTLKTKNLNPHNQFLQTGVDIGIPGILILLAICIFYFYKGVKSRNYFLVFLVCSLFFNALFESVLQKQSGIVFYSLMFSMIAVYTESLISSIKQNESVANKTLV